MKNYSWWFQPTWKTVSQFGLCPQIGFKKHLKKQNMFQNHHLVVEKTDRYPFSYNHGSVEPYLKTSMIPWFPGSDTE